jgi:hypothetical protein
MMLSRAFSSWGRLFGLPGNTTEDEEERRLWGRIPCDMATTCQLASDHSNDRLPAQVRNISRGGISLELSRPFEPGTLLSVSLPACGAEEEILACVVRCDPTGADSWELGCTFAAQLTNEDLESFGARRERTTNGDQRTWVRYPCHAQALYHIVRSPEESAGRTATVVNISPSGIALEVEQSLHVGELLNLELSRDGVLVLTILASVVRTGTGQNGTHLAGCNFIRELADDQVLTLL